MFRKPTQNVNQNVMQIWGNKESMNLNSMILTNIQSSTYYKTKLSELKTYHEIIDEIYYRVNHLEPWEKGSRRTQGLTGMCGGVRGVGGGGIVSTCFCLLYKLYTLKLSKKQVIGLMTHADSPYIRALGFMYIRFTQDPQTLYSWYDEYLEDEEEVDVKAGGGNTMKIGLILRQWLTRLEWFDTLFPRIPVPIQNEIMFNLRTRFSDPVEDRDMSDRKERSRDRSRSPRRSPRRSPPRRSPVKRRSRSKSRSESSSRHHHHRSSKRQNNRSTSNSSKSDHSSSSRREKDSSRRRHRTHHHKKSSSHKRQDRETSEDRYKRKNNHKKSSSHRKDRDNDSEKRDNRDKNRSDKKNRNPSRSRSRSQESGEISDRIDHRSKSQESRKKDRYSEDKKSRNDRKHDEPSRKFSKIDYLKKYRDESE